MFVHCSSPIWHGDDLSQCFQTDFLQTLFPPLACGLSLLVLLSQYYRERTSRRKFHSLASVVDDAEDDTSDDASDDDADSVADLTLQKTTSWANVSTHKVDKPKGEVYLVAVELLALLGQGGINAAELASGEQHSILHYDERKTSIAGLVVWTYIIALVAFRLWFSSSKSENVPHVKLWNHTALLYSTQWFLELFIFRSAIIHPRSRLFRDLTIAQFALSSLLLLIALFSRRGNESVILEYEGDIEPSQEPRASVISLASFTWADAIVWRGYKKTTELSDVWNVNVEDKAAAVLSHFRQIKKTHSLAVRLLLFFKTRLLVQGAWAMLGSVCLFIPTLLLKVILQYLEDPVSTPVNAAWLYVILLFFISAVQAVADGQGLWMGRKISMQLRAIIVGEIYSKALRRKAAAGGETELSKDKEEVKKLSLAKRVLSFGLLSFGRKKKAAFGTLPEQENQPKPTEASPANSLDTQANNGTIINLMSIDSFKVAEICAYLHFLWAAVPVQLAMAIGLLYGILGYSSFAGIIMMVLLLPLNLYIAKSFQRAQKNIMAATDGRTHATNEVLQNIRIIKYFAWERRFADNVNDKRKVEMKALRKRFIVWSLAATTWSAVPIIITFISFFIYTVVEDKPLLPSVAFPALSTFALLRIPLDQLADMVAHVQESKVSVDRVEKFLNEEETEKYVQLRDSRLKGTDVKIALQNATLSWGSKKDSGGLDSLDAFRLINVNVDFQIGRLNVIAGPTGSGKTSLLMALLGEMKLLKGDVRIPGGSVRQRLKRDPDTGLTESVAYCAQQAWLVNDTIKENILFASPFDEQRYRAVIGACALERDLEILDAGDKTLVGEKGIALSGGQKQRISLARALYCNSKHLLLDDCLSAVDSHTAKHIFENAIMGNLMIDRTCILVTHNVSLTVPRATYVVVLENGKVIAQGPPDEVAGSGALGDDLLKSRPGSRGQSVAPSRVPSDLEEEKAKASQGQKKMNGEGNGAGSRSDRKFVDTRIETKAEGSVKMTTIKMYLGSMGPWYFWIFAAFGFVFTQIGSVATNVWIRQWANAYHTQEIGTWRFADMNPTIGSKKSFWSLPWTDTFIKSVQWPARSSVAMLLGSTVGVPELRSRIEFGAYASHNNSIIGSLSSQSPADSRMTNSLFGATASRVDVGYYLGVYALIGLGYVLICLARELVLFWGSLHASWKIHDALLNAILRAKFKFFDSTPLGQLMNRFSKDIGSVDQEVAPVAIGMIHSLASVITIVILISVITPGFLIPGFFISCIYFATGFFYIHSSRDLKRIEAVQRSPLFQAFGETLSGVVTIRAYGDESRFLQDNHGRVDTHNRPFISLWATNRWLAFRVDIAGAFVAFFTGVFVITNVGHIDPGAAGLSLSYAITFTENVLWLVRLYAANEQNMNAVERVKEYIDVEQEAQAVILETEPAANWPSRGAVQFIGYSTRYRADLDLVLKNVSFNIQPAEKVGIVGRTGAGKSSLALALFRGLEAEQGKIVIDDVDIGLIGLQVLRESITIVPQDPTLFTGTLRNNLDPFGAFTDEEIFTALRKVQLISSVGKTTGGVDKSSQRQARDRKQHRSTADLLDESEDSGTTTPASSNAPTLTASAAPHFAPEAPGEMADPAAVESDMTDSRDEFGSGTQSWDGTFAVTASNVQDDNKNIFHNLSSPIAESGSNVSQGQRQLLCLARALLKAPRVLLMDEATASIDYATDSKIQEALREFKENTIITIAHRLQTIIDYDKVLVLDKGEVAEFADPWELIQRGNGSFRSMCEMSGDFDTLFELARKAWEGRRLIDDS